jgi:single-stranded-DNA-specific exonuclease
MADSIQWQVVPQTNVPEWLVQAIQECVPGLSGRFAAQVLWQRGVSDRHQLIGFLNPDRYQPASPLAFGAEIEWAIDRLKRAYQQKETVAIWGDFDADGITSTAVLWEGLGQFFQPDQQLFYFIPNRLTESHGLSIAGLDTLAERGCQLIVTCDTGSTNPDEIAYARQLGIDLIVTDHHTLPLERPDVVAIVNPRYLPSDHPLAHLSGVAVAYKLVEALYNALPDVPKQPLDTLLDLVGIGLIADLVELKGDCRYLAQRGIEQLQKNQDIRTAPRPGIAKLLELCKRSGDRPTDIAFGIGPRINAISRIQGDARFGVELLTSRNPERCRLLAEETELANTRRKALQKDVMQQVRSRLAEMDLSTTSVIVLADSQWSLGVLGLVAGQIAQEYGRPTILLSTEGSDVQGHSSLARGSARSVGQIDLYQLMKQQEHLLHKFGGHPLAAGLSLPVETIPLFTEAINRQLREQQFALGSPPDRVIQADLVVTVADLGKDLFRELKLLEPCGMGNPTPRLLIQNCWFENVRNQNIRDWKGRKVRYIKTEFEIRDDSTQERFPGVWWEHYRDDIPNRRCDVIAELDFNTYHKRYEIRLIALQPSAQDDPIPTTAPAANWVLDWRSPDSLSPLNVEDSVLQVLDCPSSWDELQVWFRRAIQEDRKLAIAYPPPSLDAPVETWRRLVGIAKYLSRTGQPATRLQLLQKLDIGDRTLQLGFESLKALGFDIRSSDQGFYITWDKTSFPPLSEEGAIAPINHFLAAIREEQFRRQYFYEIPIATVQAIAQQTQIRS